VRIKHQAPFLGKKKGQLEALGFKETISILMSGSPMTFKLKESAKTLHSCCGSDPNSHKNRGRNA
jgi:hypothetical protein